MTGNFQKLIFVGLAIIALSFFIVTHIQAQTQEPNSKDFEFRIQSKDDYIKAERMVDLLAEELYAIHQTYPELTIQHHFNTENELVDITVEGIDDPAIADQAALCFLKLEKLAVAVRDADPAYIPQRSEIKETEILNEKQSQQFIPERRIDY